MAVRLITVETKLPAESVIAFGVEPALIIPLNVTFPLVSIVPELTCPVV